MSRAFVGFLSGMIGVAVLLLATLVVSAQDRAPSGQAGTAPFKVCSNQNSPPCASAPKVIYSPDPEYSEKARKKKAQGIVILETTVGTDGHTHDIRVVRPLGYGLSEQAVKALREWKFEPGRKDGESVPVLLQIEMDFRCTDAALRVSNSPWPLTNSSDSLPRLSPGTGVKLSSTDGLAEALSCWVAAPCPGPGGTPELSPAFQRWVIAQKKTSPVGTARNTEHQSVSVHGRLERQVPLKHRAHNQDSAGGEIVE